MSEHPAPALLIALEQSGLGLAIRQSVWVYPAANVSHVLALTIFAGAVAIMDLRLLGVFKETIPAQVIGRARKVAVGALAALILTGLVLFTAEASHVALNPVFQIKLALITFGLANALMLHRSLGRVLATAPAMIALPTQFRVAAALSLTIWFAVAGVGRFIAYL